MRTPDVIRGCLVAYGTCVLILALSLTVLYAEPQELLGGFFISLLMFGGYGLLVLMPVTLIAFLSFAILRPLLDRAIWWQSILVVFAWATLLMLALGTGLGGLIWSIAIGVVAGLAFWFGAAGRRWSVPLDSL